jgi:hypothetical protein
MARYKFSFWLDCDKDNELLLADAIDDLKHKRSFAGTVRDGIRLVCDLRRGKLDVLFELFPWVRAEFLEYMQSFQPNKSAAEQRLEQQLARLEKLLLQQASTPAGPRPMVLPRPTADEDDTALLTVTKAKVDGRQITQNFINSMMRLQQ